MAAITPVTGSTPAQTGPRAVSEARVAAQRAFFQAALGKVEAPAATKPPVATTARATPSPAMFRSNTESVIIPAKPDRPVRPGSLVDIKV